jgi:hypothetical protein
MTLQGFAIGLLDQDALVESDPVLLVSLEVQPQGLSGLPVSDIDL